MHLYIISQVQNFLARSLSFMQITHNGSAVDYKLFEFAVNINSFTISIAETVNVIYNTVHKRTLATAGYGYCIADYAGGFT